MTRDELKQDLVSPIRTFRLFALEKIIQEGGPPDLRAILLDRQAREDDEECRELLPHALAALKAAEAEAGQPAPAGVTGASAPGSSGAGAAGGAAAPTPGSTGSAPAGTTAAPQARPTAAGSSPTAATGAPGPAAGAAGGAPTPSSAASGPAGTAPAATAEEPVWPPDDAEAQLALLARLARPHGSGRRLAALAGQAPAWLAAAKVPHVQAAVLRTFRPHWPADHLDELAPLLGAGSLTVRGAALQVLIERAPRQLAQFLPRLLSAEDPRLRALAVQGLALLDLDCAIEHTEAMLLSAQPASRGFAIRNCLFLPFERVKPLLLKSLAVETFPELVEKAGVILRSNPDQETPYRLWEVIERAPPKLQDSLKAVLQGVCQSLRESGVLGTNYQSFQDRLQDWVHRRVAIRKVQAWLEDLPDGNEEPATPGPDPAIPVIRWALEQALTWDLPAAAHQRVAARLAPAGTPASNQPETGTMAPTPAGGPPPGASPTTAPTAGGTAAGTPMGGTATSPAPAPTGAPAQAPTGAGGIPPVPAAPAAPAPASAAATLPGAPAEPAPDPAKALIARLNLFAPEQRQEARALLSDLLNGKNSQPPAVLAAGFRAAGRLRLLEFGAAAERQLKSAHEAVQAAALEYLGNADPDKALPFLGPFLQSRSRRIKGITIDLIRRLDPPRALSAVEFMLSNRDESEQEQALACMIQFDFPLVRKSLTDYLLQSVPEALFLKGLCLFQANPDKDNLYPLYRLEKQLLPPLDGKVRKVREATLQALQDLGLPVDPDQRDEKKLEERRQADEQRQKAPSPYSLARLKKEPARTGLARLIDALGLREYHGLSGLEPFLIGFAVLLMVVGWWATTEEAPARVITGPLRPGAVLAQRLELTGKVTRFTRERGVTIEMTGPDGIQYSIEAAIPVPDLSPGDSIQVTLVPVRVSRQGVVVARCLALKKG
ncbi:MAG: hypothetical protein GX442_01215 [Candidatus Riflebacteria bacterium]|nr:hypothetical protein [Candidatus Riflebacteria bacterium]